MEASPGNRVKLAVVHEGGRTLDPILAMPVYWNAESKFGDLREVISQGREMSKKIKQSQPAYEGSLFSLIRIRGRTTSAIYERCRDIYENNQDYYSDLAEKLGDQVITTEVPFPDFTASTTKLIPTYSSHRLSFPEAVTELEKWFALILEPRPRHSDEIEDWYCRERMKIVDCHTSSCHSLLRKFVRPFDETTMAILRSQFSSLSPSS